MPVSNKFGPLCRQTKSTSNSSSNLSGPLFPPEFEDQIPQHVKTAQEKKRALKIEKKNKKRKIKSKPSSHILNPSPPNNPTLETILPKISSLDVMEMASRIGLTFDGLPSELQDRIEEVLKNQSIVWQAR